MTAFDITELAGRTILIADDNPANLGVVADYLEYAFNIFTAMDGADALEIADTVMPDLILLDVQMPEIDGFEVCRRLKADERLQEIPVIFMTALSSIEDKIQGFTAGAVDYVTKPIQQQELLMRICTHLTLQEQKVKLQTMNAALEKRAAQLAMSTQVAQQVAAILGVDALLAETVRLIQAQFDYYCVGVWLLDAPQENFVLRAFASHSEAQKFTLGFATPTEAKSGILAHAGRSQAPYLANDVRNDPHYFYWEALPETRAELVLPLRYGESTQATRQFLGVLDIQSDQLDAFAPDDVPVLQMLADQIAIAMRNAQLYQELELLRKGET
ncbi:MAG TPA: response regulator [Anaerolineae bacterium]|nr:response regulator [Anaerolineae bacterium]